MSLDKEFCISYIKIYLLLFNARYWVADGPNFKSVDAKCK